MWTLEPRMISPSSGSTRPLMIFKIVVFPVPLSPIIATRSPRFTSKLRSVNSVWEPKDFARPFTVSTSFPLKIFGSRRISMASLTSVGFSRTSILSNIFSRLSALLMDFSRLKDFNFSMTASWCLISCCWFKYAFIWIARICALFSL